MIDTVLLNYFLLWKKQIWGLFFCLSYSGTWVHKRVRVKFKVPEYGSRFPSTGPGSRVRILGKKKWKSPTFLFQKRARPLYAWRAMAYWGSGISTWACLTWEKSNFWTGILAASCFTDISWKHRDPHNNFRKEFTPLWIQQRSNQNVKYSVV